jgi:phospholipase/lecithinase/hemolysin
MKSVLSALAVAIALPASADTLGPYTDLLVFGDSLSDGGNIAAATGGITPVPLFYPNGQFTNGDTWATTLGAAPSLSTFGGTNFAFGGATAATSGPNQDGFDIPDFADQRALYQAAIDGSALSLGDNPLATIWFGGNDLRVLLDPENAALDPVAVISNVITQIVVGVNDLATTGLSEFLVFGLPDLGLIPSVVNSPEASFGATFLSSTFNQNLAATLESLYGNDLTPNVQFFDTQGFLAELLEDTDKLGITNLTDACIVADNEETVDVNEFFFCGPDQDSYAFFDGLHPTQKIHLALANAVTDFVTPVPLPGGLSLALGGLVVLGGLARRRKVASA